MHLLSVQPGEEVIESLTRQMLDLGITAGAVASLVGAVEGCAISNMAADDATTDIITEYQQPMELSGTGEILDGKPHLHCVVQRRGRCCPRRPPALGPRPDVLRARLRAAGQMTDRALPGFCPAASSGCNRFARSGRGRSTATA
jgi:hypothetical protein